MTDKTSSSIEDIIEADCDVIKARLKFNDPNVSPEQRKEVGHQMSQAQGIADKMRSEKNVRMNKETLGDYWYHLEEYVETENEESLALSRGLLENSGSFEQK